jgi:hypothetical protein
MLRLLAAAMPALVVLTLGAGVARADYDINVDTNPSANIVFAGGMFTPTGSGANLNLNDLETALASGEVTISTAGAGSEPGLLYLQQLRDAARSSARRSGSSASRPWSSTQPHSAQPQASSATPA